MCNGSLHNGNLLPDGPFPVVVVQAEKVESREPETEMIQNQGRKANLCDSNGYALQ